MLDERVQDGYVALWANDDVVQTCDRWLEVWDGFKFHFGPEMTRVRDVHVVFHGTEYFINRCAGVEAGWPMPACTTRATGGSGAVRGHSSRAEQAGVLDNPDRHTRVISR